MNNIDDSIVIEIDYRNIGDLDCNVFIDYINNDCLPTENKNKVRKKIKTKYGCKLICDKFNTDNFYRAFPYLKN